MPSYTFHPSAGVAPRDPAALDDAVLVRDAFSLPAFVFPVLWALWHRMWLVALLVLVAQGGIIAAIAWLDVHPLAGLAADGLVSLFFGLEAAAIRSWHLARKGKPAALVVIADDEDGAETKALAVWGERYRPRAGMSPPVTPPATSVPPSGGARPWVAPTPAAAAPAPAAGPVIGLYPDSEVKR